MEAIQETVQNIMQQLEKKQKASPRPHPEVLLKKIFSKKELQHIKLNYTRKGILNINVDSSAWLYQLSLKKEKFLAKLHSQTDQIKDIRFYLGATK